MEPQRDATDAWLANMSPYGRRIDITFDVDLGELVPGHRVIARGLELASDGAVLHYEFVPGMTEDRTRPPFWWYWTVLAEDDRGTVYEDSNSGAFDPRGGGLATHGERDLGGRVPRRAKRLTLRFEPAAEWSPPAGYRNVVDVDLERRSVQ